MLLLLLLLLLLVLVLFIFMVSMPKVCRQPVPAASSYTYNLQLN